MATLAARLLEVNDGAAAAILAAWTTIGVSDSVTRDYVSEEIMASMTGRKVLVSPPIDDDEPAKSERYNRGEVLNSYKVRVEIYEKYTTAGRPTKAWLDTRVQFVDTVYTAMDLITPGALLIGALWCEAMEKTYIADVEAVDKHKMFFAVIDATYQEIVNG